MNIGQCVYLIEDNMIAIIYLLSERGFVDILLFRIPTDENRVILVEGEIIQHVF